MVREGVLLTAVSGRPRRDLALLLEIYQRLLVVLLDEGLACTILLVYLQHAQLSAGEVSQQGFLEFVQRSQGLEQGSNKDSSPPPVGPYSKEGTPCGAAELSRAITPFTMS